MQQIPVTKQIKNYLYNPENKLGKGSYSTVYVGQHISTNQVVAIKVIDAKCPKSDIERVLVGYQIRALKLMNHENVIKVNQIYQTPNNIYIIYQYCELGNLGNLIQTKGKLSEEQAVEIVIQILLGLIHVHAKGVTHRDLKPQNILIKNGVKERIFKIIDFGFCDIGENRLQQSYNVGSPLYMSPQAFLKSKYSTKSDLWAVGIIFLEMMMGDLPFKGQEYDTLLKQMESEQIIKNLNINLKLKSILSKMLSVEVEKRIDPTEAYTLLTGYRSESIKNVKPQIQPLSENRTIETDANGNSHHRLANNSRKQFMANQKNSRGNLHANYSPAPRVKPRDISPGKPLDKAMAHIKQSISLSSSKQSVPNQSPNYAVIKLRICTEMMQFLSALNEMKSIFPNSQRIILLTLKMMKQYLEQITIMFQEDSRVLNEERQEDLKNHITHFNQMQVQYNQNKIFSDLYFSFVLEYLRLEGEFFNYLQFWIKDTITEFKRIAGQRQKEYSQGYYKIYLYLIRANELLEYLKKNQSKLEQIPENKVIESALKDKLEHSDWGEISSIEQKFQILQILKT